jgi:putative peptidoglycan lipid II flippase
VLLNLCIIGALLASCWQRTAAPIRAAPPISWGPAVALGRLPANGLAVLLGAPRGFRFRLHRPRLSPDVRKLGVLIMPAMFGAGVYQLSRFPRPVLPWAPARRFVHLSGHGRPAQPVAARHHRHCPWHRDPARPVALHRQDDDAGGAQRVQSNAIEIGMLLTIPAAVGLFCAAQPLASAIYLGGKFDAGDVAATAATLAMLVLGLPAYVMVKVLTPGFFARRTPARRSGPQRSR